MVRVDAVYERRGPGEISGQERYQPGKKRYRAELRLNTGHWRRVVEFTAENDKQAKLILQAKHLPKRKPNDKTYLVVHKLWCLDEAPQGD